MPVNRFRSSRGIGLAFVKQLSANNENQVIATCRSPSTAADLASLASSHKNVHVVGLDVTDQASIKAAFDATKAIVGSSGIDYLVNNAGNGYLDSVATVTPDQLESTFKTHVVGPLLVFQTFLPLVQAGSRKVVVNISSQLASIGADIGPGLVSYSVAKAALHVGIQTYKITKEFPDIIAFPFHPGHVETALGGPTAPLTPEAAVAKHIPIFESATLKTHAGHFVTYEGKELPW